MKHPIPLSSILAQEYAALRPEPANEKAEPLAALCLSGGGIRSATFGLGVIQGLAERGLLREFDYLSTVSGGGYIGGWLTAWIQRAHGIENVIPHLCRNAPPITEGKTDPIQHLREYNSYLSPVSGFLSADTWTLAATVVRNMLLNWLVFVPVLMAALMLPRLLLALARLSDFVPLRATIAPLLIPVLSALLFATAIFNMLRYLPGVGGEDHSEVSYLKFCLGPLILSAVAFILNDAWFTGGDIRTGALQAIGYWQLTFGVVAAGFAGWMVYLLFCGKSFQERRRLFVPVSGAVLLTSWTGGSGIWLLVDRFFPQTDWPLYTSIAVPLVLLSLMLAGCVFVGFTSRTLQDEDREWFSRSGAWALLFCVFWLGICALVLVAPGWVFGLRGWQQSALTAAGGTSGWICALTGFSPKTKPDDKGESADANGLQATLMSVAMKLAAPVFAIAFLVALAMATDWVLMITHLGAQSVWNGVTETFNDCPGCDWRQHEAMLKGTRSYVVCLLGAGFLAFGWAMAWFININKFSLQGMYRNRLIRAYLGASNQKHSKIDFTGFTQSDNLAMHALKTELKPFHVVNMTLNLVKGKKLAWQQRKAESFTATPLHCGNSWLGYRPSLCYGGKGGISLGTAIAISGAAASPNMGYNSSPVVGFIMTLFNARLGAWMGNPGEAGEKTWRRDGPTSAFAAIVKEALGLTNDTSSWVYLSDGGHFENLGLYEMVRRRCGCIVVSDAGCDPKSGFQDLGNALRKIRIDMHIPIHFDDGSFEAVGRQERRFAIARIRYSMVDESAADGVLVYLKPMVLGNEPPDCLSYRTEHPAFPHESTADQFFNESQTESYRMLGLHTIDEICRGLVQGESRVKLGDLVANLTGTADRKASAAVA